MTRRPLRVLNMTRLFSKEMFIYSFFDVKLKKPARLSTLAYFFVIGGIVCGLLWGVFNAPFNPYTLAIAAGVPIGSAILMSKPIWNGRNFLSWFLVQIHHIIETKLFCDGWKTKPLRDYKIDFSLYLSRVKDFIILKGMK